MFWVVGGPRNYTYTIHSYDPFQDPFGGVSSVTSVGRKPSSGTVDVLPSYYSPRLDEGPGPPSTHTVVLCSDRYCGFVEGYHYTTVWVVSGSLVTFPMEMLAWVRTDLLCRVLYTGLGGTVRGDNWLLQEWSEGGSEVPLSDVESPFASGLNTYPTNHMTTSGVMSECILVGLSVSTSSRDPSHRPVETHPPFCSTDTTPIVPGSVRVCRPVLGPPLFQIHSPSVYPEPLSVPHVRKQNVWLRVVPRDFWFVTLFSWLSITDRRQEWSGSQVCRLETYPTGSTGSRRVVVLGQYW